MRTSSMRPLAELSVAPLGVLVLRLSPTNSVPRLTSSEPSVVPVVLAAWLPLT